MKIIYCSKEYPNDKVDKSTDLLQYPQSKTRMTDPIAIKKKDFQIISNIINIDYCDDLKFAKLYDKLMSKEVFLLNYENLDHKIIFEEYKKFNSKIAEKINKVCDEDDLVIVNDSSLLLLPVMVSCRVAIRNLKFDHTFIERLPFYYEILKGLFKAQKFFDSIYSLDSFKDYINSSYELRDENPGGIWYIVPYLDRFSVLDVLEHFVYYFDENKSDEKTDKRFNSNILEKIRSLTIPKTKKIILTSSHPDHLEHFIAKNPNYEIRFINNLLKPNDDIDLTKLEKIKRMYKNFKVIDVTGYSNVIIEMIYCDVYIGNQYKELASAFKKPFIEDSFNSQHLSNNIFIGLRSQENENNEFFGEEEYIREFMKINGYDIILSTDQKEDEIIKKLLKEINFKISPKNEINTTKSPLEISNEENSFNSTRSAFYYKKTEKSDERILYLKRNELESVKNSDDDSKPFLDQKYIVGENPYYDILNQEIPKETQKLDLENTIEKIRKMPNKTILLDYDGTLTNIVEEPIKAAPDSHLLNLLLKLNGNKQIRLVICTGRSKDNMDDWIPKEIEVYAEHGSFYRKNGKWISLCKDISLDHAENLMNYYHIRTPESFLEKKKTALVFHYRKIKDFDVSKLYSLLKLDSDNHVSLGKCILEVKLSSKYKVAEKVQPDVVIGDDLTDEDMFKASKGLKIKVGQGRSYADGHLEDVDTVLELLAQKLSMTNEVDASLLRCDGRLPNELRRIEIMHNTIDNKPYLSFRQGNTFVRTTFRPNIDKSQFSINLFFSETSRNEQINERFLYDMKLKLTKIFSLIVMSDNQLEISVEILQDDGSLFSVIVNCISACLCFYGVTLKDMYLSVNVNENVDLSFDEENKNYHCAFVLSPNNGKIAFVECTGRMQRQIIDKATELASQSIKSIYEQLKNYFV